MTGLPQSHRCPFWLVLVALATVFVPSNTSAYAQYQDQNVCTSGTVYYSDTGWDGGTSDAEDQTVCLTYDSQAGLDSYVETDNDYAGDFYSEYGDDNMFTYGVSAEAQLNGVDANNNSYWVADSGMVYSGTDWSGSQSAVAEIDSTPQQYPTYQLNSSWAECESGNGPYNCDWWAPNSGPSVEMTMTSSTPPPPPLYSYTITPAAGPTGYAANGNLVSYTDSVMGSWTLNYDALNRLTMATGSQVVDGNSSYAWTYDSFGNRQTQTGNGNMGTVTTQADSSNASPHNQIISTNARGVPWTPGYDAAGNMQDDGANRYLYDADGRVCATAPIGSSTGTQYLYDASGKRVAKGTITSWSCDTTSNGFTLTTQYIIGPNGEQMTEIAYNGSSPTWSHTNVPLPGAMATYLNDGQEPHFRLTDWLGTTRAQTSSVGTAELTCQSLPFGDPTSFPCTSTPATEQFFTGYERDSETGNDYAQARHYANSMGRFLSPDPSGLKYADQMNPQSFNLYSYVRNNPLINTDPTGLECVWDDGSYDSNDDPSTGDGAVDQSGNHTGCSGQGGTWIDHSYFSDNNMADWSSQANQTLADMTTPTITVTAPDNPALMQSASFMMSQVQSWGNNITGLSNIMSYTALDAFKWAFDGKHTPNGCASGLAGCVYFYGNWCGKGGSGAPVDAVDAACMVHDFLYEKFGFTLPSNYQGGNEALQVINQGLCNTTVDLQPGVPAAEINLYFGPIVSAGNIGKGGSPACK